MKRVSVDFGFYPEDFKPLEAQVFADIDENKVEIVSVMIKWRSPNGMTVDLDAAGMLTHSALSEMKDYVRQLYGVDNGLWPDGVA